jgi:thiamine-phosphate pyrophosphorylase
MGASPRFPVDWQEPGASARRLIRILDAAANRAREGLRVVEDFARFELNDAHLTRELKECRHELAAALSEAGLGEWLAARDTPGDVGTQVSTPAESVRTSPFDVAQANFKRVQEALRSLEEYGKCVSATLGRRCEAVRYRVYTLEKAVLGTAANRERLADCKLYWLLTRPWQMLPASADSADAGSVRHGDSLDRAVRETLHAGVDVVQIREKDLPDAELLEWARTVRRWTRETGTLLIVNDRPDLALLCEADGVHVGQTELPVAAVRRIVGPRMLVGVSTRNIEQARKAVLDGADYLGVGPVFPSATKSFESLAGLDYVRQVAAEIALPWFAIGGIDESNVAEVVAAGATRIAVSAALSSAESPASVAEQLRRTL